MGVISPLSLLKAYELALVRQGKSEGTVSQRIGHIDRMIRAGIDVTTVDSDELIDYLLGRTDWAPEYRRKIADSCRSFFSWMVKTHRRETNPATELPIIKRPTYRAHPAPDEVVLTGFETGTLAERGIISLASVEMLRRTEIATLHPQNRHDLEITFTGKGGKIRTVPLSEGTYEILRQLEKEQGTDVYYFPGRFGGHLHPQTVYKWAKRQIGADWTLHSLRHRGATNGYHRTKDLRAVQELLGHASLTSTQIYTGVNQDQLRAVIEANQLPRPLNSRHQAAAEKTWSRQIYFVDLNAVTPDDVRVILEAAQRRLNN